VVGKRHCIGWILLEWWHDATESVVVIRETRMQRQQTIAQQQPTLMEWQHKLSHLVNEDSSSPHV